MIVDYSAEIKITIFQSVCKRHYANVTNKDRCQIAGESRQKLPVSTA